MSHILVAGLFALQRGKPPPNIRFEQETTGNRGVENFN
jgi:hypothetical protein